MQLKLVEAKHIVTKSKLPGEWCINPYVGCLHGCVYCYACFMRRFSGHIGEVWGSFVDVKQNGGELFPADFRKIPNGSSIFLGSVTDAYQPVEKKYRITRSILEFLAEHPEKNLSITILTKSDLVIRDLELLQNIPCSVGCSIALHEERIRRILEPCASPIRQRASALKKLHDAGIHTFAFIGPILPFLTPLPLLFDMLSGKVDFVYGETLNTRCGNMRQIVNAVEKCRPALAESFREAATEPQYWDSIRSEFQCEAEKHAIPVEGFFQHH